MKFTKSLVAAAVMSMAFNAFAVQKDITVTANVDPSLDMTLSDGQPLPDAIEMQYMPGTGLSQVSMMAKIWSNDATKDVLISLANPAVLHDLAGSDVTVPISVSFAGDPLTTTATTLAAATLFPTGETDQGSVAKSLSIAQTTSGVLAAGNYTGVVSVVLTQATTVAPE